MHKESAFSKEARKNHDSFWRKTSRFIVEPIFHEMQEEDMEFYIEI